MTNLIHTAGYPVIDFRGRISYVAGKGPYIMMMRPYGLTEQERKPVQVNVDVRSFYPPSVQEAAGFGSDIFRAVVGCPETPCVGCTNAQIGHAEVLPGTKCWDTYQKLPQLPFVSLPA